jgi:hypothetical protein
MIGRPTRRLGSYTVEPKLTQIDSLHKRIPDSRSRQKSMESCIWLRSKAHGHGGNEVELTLLIDGDLLLQLLAS